MNRKSFLLRSERKCNENKSRRKFLRGLRPLKPLKMAIFPFKVNNPPEILPKMNKKYFLLISQGKCIEKKNLRIFLRGLRPLKMAVFPF